MIGEGMKGGLRRVQVGATKLSQHALLLGAQRVIAEAICLVTAQFVVQSKPFCLIYIS